MHRTLRGLPARRAPRTLEQRVLAELERRAALPWWRRSYLHWPFAMRAVFFGLSAAAAAGAVVGSILLLQGADGPAEAASRLPALEFAKALIGSVSTIYHAIPPVWLYGGLAAIAAAYATLVGVGAAAYRLVAARR